MQNNIKFIKYTIVNEIRDLIQEAILSAITRVDFKFKNNNLI